MGNAIAYRENLRKIAAEQLMSGALRSFIENECPVYLTALKTDDFKLRAIVVKQFNESFPGRVFDNVYSILPHLERLRLKRVQNLSQLTQAKFDSQLKIKLSCLPCKINDYLTLAYFDTGCSISCITLENARKLNLISLIDHKISGVAVGFGCNRQIVGFLTNLPVQIGSELLFNINFVVINQANADFLLIGSDFMHKQGLQMDYPGGKIIFPRQIIDEQRVDFMPSKPEERDFFFDLFKYQMLKQNRALMRNYFNHPESAQPNDEQNHGEPSGLPSSKRFQQDRQVNRTTNQKNNRNTNLYVRVQINGRQLLALIDTGADTSKISDNLADRLDILSFIDYDRRKIAHGLGSVISIGQIPPIPVKFFTSDTATAGHGLSESAETPKSGSVLFVPFEVLKENRVNVLLLGSDFLTHYGCRLDFSRKSIDISLGSVALRYALEEKEPNNINLIADLKKPPILQNDDPNDHLLGNSRINAYQLVPELDELKCRIERKGREHQINKKLKKYKIDRAKEFGHLNRIPSNRPPDQRLFSTALSALDRKPVYDEDDTHGRDLWPFSKLDELNQQASSFLSEEANDATEFKNRPSGQMIYCNDLLPENEFGEFVIKVNFV